MSSKTSSRSTLTTVPSTMSPSLKYLMVRSIAARNASSDPMSLTATLGVEVACVLLVMCGLAPDADRMGWIFRAENQCSAPSGLLPKDHERAGPTWPGYDPSTPRRPTGRSPDHAEPHEDTT